MKSPFNYGLQVSLMKFSSESFFIGTFFGLFAHKHIVCAMNLWVFRYTGEWRAWRRSAAVKWPSRSAMLIMFIFLTPFCSMYFISFSRLECLILLTSLGYRQIMIDAYAFGSSPCRRHAKPWNHPGSQPSHGVYSGLFNLLFTAQTT